LIARKLTISGRVQGVGFRWFVQRAAEDRGLVGYVRNLPDGRVEVWAEGPEEDVEALRGVLESGPSWAVVTDIEVLEVEPSGEYKNFSIAF